MSGVNPVGRLGLGGVLDLAGREEAPVVKVTSGDFNVINENLVNLIELNNKNIDVVAEVSLARDVLGDEVVGALVVEDDVDAASFGTADIRSEHEGVGRVSVEVLLVQTVGDQLDVSSTAVDVLLVLD